MQLGHWDQGTNLPDLTMFKLFKMIQANGDDSASEWVFDLKKSMNVGCQKKRTAGARIKGALMINRLKTPPGNCNQDYRFMSPKTKGWNPTNGALVEDVPIHVGVILRFSRRLKKKTRH